MFDEAEFKIKGAAARASESESSEPAQGAATVATPPPAAAREEGEVTPSNDKESSEEQNGEAKDAATEEDMKRYRWYKCACDTASYGRDHYFLHMDTQESRWEEPTEPYWIWDAEKQTPNASGLQQPKSSRPATATSEPDPEYTGYNPKIHGSYDPNAPYAQYHNKKRQEEELIAQGYPPGFEPATLNTGYATAGTFNRFTGNFQGAEKSADRHTDFAKSGRQMNAYFDVDAAANMHDGRSLKEERRNEKMSKKQIKELADKRRAKKEKKRMDFYKS